MNGYAVRITVSPLGTTVGKRVPTAADGDYSDYSIGHNTHQPGALLPDLLSSHSTSAGKRDERRYIPITAPAKRKNPALSGFCIIHQVPEPPCKGGHDTLAA